jgi:hypothetical protein
MISFSFKDYFISTTENDYRLDSLLTILSTKEEEEKISQNISEHYFIYIKT